MTQHTFHPSIVREYDMRGIYGDTLHDADAYWLGRTFADWIGGTGVVAVGRDGRNSSPTLQSELIRGLSEGGCGAINIGIGPTPMLYFAVKTLGVVAGIMVTGSHNPAHHNGFKMMRTIKQDGGSVHGQQIKDLAARLLTLPASAGKPVGGVSTQDIKQAYVDSLIEKSGLDICHSGAGQNPELSQGIADQVRNDKNWANKNIIWDCGNGAAGSVIDMVTSRINASHHVLYKELDGNFPNHDPDPTVEKNLAVLAKEVKDRKALIGLAFDGDADRLGVIDDRGQFIPMDDLITVLAADVLQDNPGAVVIADVKCAPHLFEEVKKLGGRPILWKTGHSPIKVKMIEENAPFAGEFSGHLFFADTYFGFDDGIYAALRLLTILQKTGKKLSELLAHLPPRVAMPELRLDVDDADKFALVEQFKEAIQAHKDFPQNGVVHTIDGIRVETPKGWLLMRASNTQAAIVVRLEAQSEVELQKLAALMRNVFMQLQQPDLADKIAA